MAQPDKTEFLFPNYKQRVSIMGRTGSGKTQFGAWLLSEAPFDKQPYVIIDYKGDDLLNASDRIRQIGVKELPRRPGLYIMRPRPSEAEAVEAWLWKAWEREKIGLYIDEGYMLPKEGAFDAILTQGRSKRIPVITLTQRPVWISRFVISQADYFALFHMHDVRDRQTVQAVVPKEATETRLGDYESYWFDVGRDALFHLKPAPDANSILDRIDERLSPRRKAI